MMKKYFIFIFLIIVVLFSAVNYFKNKRLVLSSSHKSGIFLKPFKLTLFSNKTSVIRYTFDSSNPTSKSYKYQNPILINGQESNDSLSYINTTIDTSIVNFEWRPPLEQDQTTAKIPLLLKVKIVFPI